MAPLVLGTLSSAGISIVSSQGVAAGSGRWGMILWVKPNDYDTACTALGI